MELQQIQHFLVTARLGSVSQAADELAITQSGLSRSLRTLEEFIGLPLFRREARGMVLSEYGQHLLPRATAIWNQRQRAIDDMNAYKALKGGRLQIGIHSVFAYTFGPEAVRRFSAEYPDIELTIVAGADPDLSGRLVDGKLDFAFTLFTPGVRDSRLYYETMFRLKCSTYARPSHPLAERSRLSLEEISTQGWALAAAESFRHAFEEHFTTQLLPAPRRIVQCSSIALLIELVANDDFLTILPDAIAQAEPLRQQLVRIDSDAPAGHPFGGLVYRHNRVATLATNALQEIFREVGRNIEVDHERDRKFA